MNANMRRDILRKIILELLVKSSSHYTDLEKRVCASCFPFITINTFKYQFKYLLDNGFLKRISRGIYEITPKGKKYLELLTFQE